MNWAALYLVCFLVGAMLSAISFLAKAAYTSIVEAEGHASAIRAQGEAEADIIFKKGDAEARAINVKAEAYQEYNQAAVVDKLIIGLPELVKALTSPLSKVDKITVVSAGDSTGMNKITADLTKVAAQVPALFEALSGMQMSDLLSKVRVMDSGKPPPDILANGETNKRKPS